MKDLAFSWLASMAIGCVRILSCVFFENVKNQRETEFALHENIRNPPRKCL